MDKFHNAVDLYHSGEFTKALLAFGDLLAHDSGFKESECLLYQALCHSKLGNPTDAWISLESAKTLARDGMKQAKVDFTEATLLIEEGRKEEGITVLSNLVRGYGDRFGKEEQRDFYEAVQIQRGFTLMHLERYKEACPILAEAASFDLENDTHSRVHCNLARCYHEIAEYVLAKQHPILAQKLGVPDDWEASFRYYFGYTLFELKEFGQARREFILCLQSRVSGPPPRFVYKMLAATSRKLGEGDEARLYDKKADTEES